MNLLKKKNISKLLFFSHKETSMGLFAAAVSMYAISFLLAFFSVHLVKHYKVKKSNIGFVFSIMTVPYLASCAILPGLLKDRVPRRFLFVISMYSTTIAFAIIGPLWFTFLPDKFEVLCVGLTLLGLV